mmetsp:Transcript_35106/g.55916  ORF Transcript_35106/g.55916 Transcript_35106/m.55916 type:complete len:204 (-) Transcript_35106:1002-1613(-)
MSAIVFSSASCKSTQEVDTQLAPIFTSLSDKGSTARAISARAAFALARSPALPTSVTTTVTKENLSLRNCACTDAGAEFSCAKKPLEPSVRPLSSHSTTSTARVCSLAAPAKDTSAASSKEHLLPKASAIAWPASRDSLPVHNTTVLAADAAVFFVSGFSLDSFSAFWAWFETFFGGAAVKILERDSPSSSMQAFTSSTPAST